MGALPSALGQIPDAIRDRIPSAEQDGVKCAQCDRDLPRNNWSFFDHARDLGFIAFYDTLPGGKRLVKYIRRIENPQKPWQEWDSHYSCLACLQQKEGKIYDSLKMAVSGHALLYLD